MCLFRNLATLILLLSRLNRSIFSWQQIPYKISCITSRTASVTGELQSQVPVTWLSLHFWWKMTFNPSLKIHRFTINIYAWNQLKYTEDVYGYIEIYCITSVFIYIVYKHRILLLEVDSISKQMSRWFYLKEKI